jgi:predicted anti-sigma-YlaC factor YlaD
MRCPRTELAILDRELGRLLPQEERELALHLARCARCAKLQAGMRILNAELARLRTEPPFEIDLAPHVRSRLPSLDPVDRAAVPARQLGWAAASAIAAGLTLVVFAALFAPQLSLGARQALGLLSSVRPIASGLASTIAAAVAALFGALGSVLDSLPVLLRTVEPVAMPFIVLGYLAMAATIISIVGRDLKTARHPQPREES